MEEARSLADMAPGRRVGPYRLVAQISSGAGGVVYRAVQEGLGRNVALKVVRVEPDAPSARNEARAMARVSHPNVARVFEAGALSDGLWFAIEWIDGWTFAEAISRHELDVPTLVRLGARVARALEGVHAAGILHRDVKPENIVLDAAGEPRLVDFGLASNLAGEFSGSTVEGTLPYLSPEGLAGDRSRLDTRSDVFALGVTLYRGLTGAFPYPASTALELARRFQAGRAPDPSRIHPRVPPRLGGVVRRAIELDPARRYRTAAELARDLEECLEAGASGSRRGRRIVLASATAIAVLGVVAAARRVSSRPERPEPESESIPANGGPPDAAALVARAWQRYWLSEHDAAAADLELALAREPRRVDALCARALLRLERGDRGGAETDLAAAREIEPGGADVPAHEAAFLRQVDRLDDALIAAEAALERDPAHVLALYERAVVLGVRNGNEALLEGMDELVRRNSTRAVALFLRGKVLYERNDASGALASWEESLRIDASFVPAQFYVALRREDQDRLPEALRGYDLCLALDPGGGMPLLQRAGVRLQLGDGPAALADARKAVEMHPGWWRAWLVLGRILGREGLAPDARVALERALELSPERDRETVRGHLDPLLRGR